MNVAVELSIQAPPQNEVDALVRALGYDVLTRTIGGKLAETTRQHFTKLDSERPNQMGGKRTHFWGLYSNEENTYWEPTAEGVKVVVNDPQSGNPTGTSKSILARKYHGGPEIHPVLAKWLTISANAESYGRRAGTFDLEFSMVGGRPALVKRTDSGDPERYTAAKGGRWSYDIATHRAKFARVKKHTVGDVMYWLTKRVRAQGPDHSVIPSDAEYQAAAAEGFNELGTSGGLS